MLAPAIAIAGPTPRQGELQRALGDFRALHARFVEGAASDADAARYRRARRLLLTSLAAQDDHGLRPGQRKRLLVRVANALPVELVSRGGAKSFALTLNVSTGGFAALVAPVPKPGDTFAVSLRLPGRGEVRGLAQVVDSRARNSAARVSFRFQDLRTADVDRLEAFVAGVVLPQLAG